MKTKKYALIVLSILMILLVFASSASAADANATDVLSVDESTSINNEKLALDYSLDNAASNDTNAVENDKEILQNPNSDDVLGLNIEELDFPGEITAGEEFNFSYKTDVNLDYITMKIGTSSYDWSVANNEGTLNYTYTGEMRGNVQVNFEFMGNGETAIKSLYVTINKPAPPTDTWYVNASAPGGDGKTPADAFKTLKDALNNTELQYGNTIMIASGEYKGENNTGLEITKNLNFVKYGDSEAIFDAENLGQIWKFTDTSANITGLTFRNGKTDDKHGGAIYMKSGNVNNCTFTDNNATNKGGAIYIGSGNLNNCTFTDNTAQSENGGAIYMSNGNVTNCNFTNNTAQSENGGAIYIFNGGDINNCTFTDNSAQSNHGGAIYFNIGGNVNNCNFTGNNAQNVGGAIFFNDGGNVTNCNFTGNTASGYAGGAIYMSSGNLNNCTFTDNNATNKGGAIYIGSGNVTNCTFTDNNATNNGGAIYIHYDGDINNCTFTNNTAQNDNGGAIHFNNGGNVNNCNFAENTASYMGGAIYFNNRGNVNNCTFTDNNATWGGAICFEKTNANGTVTNNAFVNNSAKHGKAISSSSVLKSVDNNWWGSNNPDWKELIDKAGIPSSYAVLNITADPSEISNDKTSEIATKFVWNGTNENATSLLPKRNIKLSSNGNLTETEGYVGLTSQFSAADGDIYYVNATVDNEMLGVNIVKIPIPTNINVTITSLNLTVEETSLINATLNPSEAGSLEFNSSDDTVAVVEQDSDGNWIVRGVAKGNANITVSFPGSERYAPANKTIEVTVNLKDAKWTYIDFIWGDEEKLDGAVISSLPLNYSPTCFVKDANGTGLPAGTNITISCKGDENYTINSVVQDDGNFSVDVSDIALGTYKVTFSAGKDYTTATATVTIVKGFTKITVENETVSLKAGEEVGSGANLTPADAGNLTYTSSNESIAVVVDGKIKAHAAGTANITVSFAENDRYRAAANKTIEVTVTLNDASVTVNNETLNLEEDETFTIVATTKPKDLNVEYIQDDTGVYTVDDKGVVTAVKEGTGSITVSVGDNKVYAKNSTVITVIVSAKPAPSKENLTISAAADPITAGDNATVIVTGLKNATGNVYVIIKVDEMYSAPINDGKATITVPGLTESVTAEVSYPGDNNYNNASTTVDITVNPAPDPSKKNLTIKANAEPIKAGENATVKVTGLENATGEVSVIANGKTYTAPIENGEASITVPDLTENTTANVNYKGDGTYNAATTTVNITVNPAPVPEKKNLTIKANAEPITAGENATVKVTGLENATGNVSVRAGNGIYFAPIENGEATVIIPGLKENTVGQVSYPGDDNYNNASTTVDITVNPAPDPSKKNLTIKANAEPIKAGENATVKVTGLENATGEVSVIANGKTYTAPIKNGEASITVPDLTENTTANVNYKGDDTYNSATTTVNITVNPKGKENATISIDAPTEAPEGDNVTVTVTLPEDATGTVTIGNEAVPLVNGTASAVLTNLPAGNTTVPITYSGDEKYNAIETEINITVIEDKTINVKAPDVTKYYHGPERFVVNVTDSKGKALANKSVTITINGVTYNRTTNANGTCSLALNLDANVYNVTTTVENNTVNSVVTIFTTVNGTDVVKVFRNGTQYYATFLDGNGKYLAEGSAVRFNINGVMYDRKVTGDKGLAKLNINLQQGEYIITATNLNTTEMSSNNITVLSRIIENNDLTKFYRNASQYTVKIIGDDGKVVGAGVDVTFNVNGVLYTRQTNASGIAKLNINLPAGDYIITAECKECKVSNNIKVLPVLTAQDMVKKYGAPDQFVATLVDGQGNPYARQTVQFNINGVLYNRVTDSAGQAKLNIRLMPGQYIITSSYNGCNIANKITVQG